MLLSRPSARPLALGGLLAAGCSSEGPGFDVILISIDGAPRALIDEEWANLEVLPGISGSYVPMKTTAVTDTKAAHARMLTGYPPEVTTVVSSDQHGVIPPDISVFERLRAAYERDVSLSFVASKPSMLGFEEGETFQHAGEACDYTYNQAKGTRAMGKVMREALGERSGRDHFAFLHFGAVDEAGHAAGERSSLQRVALSEVDGEIGLIRDFLADEGRLDRAVFYVTTDHGFTPYTNTHFTDAAQTWLVTDDEGVGPDGGVVDQVAWTILARYGLDRLEPDPPYDPL